MFGEVAPNQFLYHYTPASKLLNHILPEARLRFSTFARTNDPRENKDFSFSMTVENESSCTHEEARRCFLEVQRRFNQGIKQDVRLLCFSADFLVPPPYDIFGRGYSHSRMWAQYAERHTGACLILDCEAIGREIADRLGNSYQIYSGNVRYRNGDDPRSFMVSLERLLKCGYEQCVEEHVRQHHQALWFSKTLDWEHEHEHRYVLVKPPSHGTDPVYVSIRDSLRGIVAGADVKSGNLRRIRKWGERLGLPIARTFWQNGIPMVLPVLTQHRGE